LLTIFGIATDSPIGMAFNEAAEKAPDGNVIVDNEDTNGHAGSGVRLR
jgi:hypothetical protein